MASGVPSKGGRTMIDGRRSKPESALRVSAGVLSPREYEYLVLRAQGLRMDDIARVTDTSLSTVKSRCQTVHRKLKVTNTVDALRAVGWITVPEKEA